jgi:hypothetical protein
VALVILVRGSHIAIEADLCPEPRDFYDLADE